MMGVLKQHVEARRGIGLAILIAAVVLSVIGISFAVFTSQDHQRSVVRNRDTDSIQFSSDKLYQVVDASSPKSYYYPAEKENPTLSFTVCNYAQGKPMFYNSKTIEYRVTVQIQNGTEGFAYEVARNEASLGAVEVGQSKTFGVFNLEKDTSSQDRFDVKVSKDDLGAVDVIVTVTPLDYQATQNRQLCAKLHPIENASAQGVHLETEYPDDVRGVPADFDAYNYFVEIVGGDGKVSLTWDSEKLDIDPFFKDKAGASGEPGNYTFAMDAEQASATYLISFFRRAGCAESFSEWNDLDISATLLPPVTQETTG